MRLLFAIMSTMLLMLTGCDLITEHKYTSGKLNDSEVKKFMTPIEDEEEYASSRIQSSEPRIVIPENLKQKVSLTLNENVSLKSILCETARKLDINFQIDSNIDSRIIFQAKQKPFIEVLDALCDMANLRYTISNGLVKVVKDSPFTAMYNVQFLNLSRDSENKVSIATEVSAIETQKSQTSDSNLTLKTKTDFWSELDDSLKIILSTGKNADTKYSINRQSGVVTVCANSKQQRDVREFLDRVKRSTMSQVLIEAKVIEVALKNEYRRGINWNLVQGDFKLDSDFYGNASKNTTSFSRSDKAPMAFSYTKKNMSSVINALEEFGSIRTISNPRITAMNNQAAVLKIAQNYVYFKLNYDKSYTSTSMDRTDISVSSDIKTVPIGLVMFVQPSIDLETNTVSLFLRPTLTRLFESVNDPAVDIAMKSSLHQNASYESSKIPVTDIREVASVLKLNDGEIAVLGGFMETHSTKDKTGIPGWKDIPGFGETASSAIFGDQVSELVILIKVKLLNKPHNQKAADIRLQRFVPDPRPF